jgi:hypothetical protein
MGRSLLDYVLLPLRLVWLGDFGYARFDGRLHLLWLLVVPLAVRWARRDATIARCLIVSLLLFVLWAASSQQTRLLIPALPLLAIAGARGLGHTLSAIPRQRWQSLAEIASTLALAGCLLDAATVYLRQTPRLVRDIFRLDRDLATAVVHPVWTWIDETLPASARLLFLNTNQGFFCRRDYLADSFFEASQVVELVRRLENEGAVRQALVDKGITHVLIDAQNRGIPYPRPFLEFLSSPRHVTTLYRSPEGRYTVLEIVAANLPATTEE